MTRKCSYCDRPENAHHEACPGVNKNSQSEWNQGYTDGRSNRASKDLGPTYKLGYGHGVVAQEETENGFDPVYEGRRW